jgi:peroxiredoxin
MSCLRLKNRLTAVLLLILAAALIGTAACKVTSNTALPLNKPAPDFNLKDLDGKSVSLSSLRGKWVLMNFWQTTCSPCVTEMPFFKELDDEWAGRSDAVFLSINLGESLSKVKRFLELRNYTFRVLLDTNWDCAKVYQVHYTPTTCLIDPQGNLKFIIIGQYQDKTNLDAQLADFMTQSP